MGVISIPKALAEMDGMFGYKIVKVNTTGQEVDYVIKKEDILDWIFEVVFNLEQHRQTREKTMGAFQQIAERIKGADDGEFSQLIQAYATSDEPIDYDKVREVLKTSLKYHPPRVYSRTVSSGNNNRTDNSGVERDLKKLYLLYLQNMRKSFCNEENEVTIFREDAVGQEVSDLNLRALAFAMYQHCKEGKPEIIIVEPDYRIGTRMELMRYETLKDLNVVFGLDQVLRIEILKYQLELLNAKHDISLEEISSKTEEVFKASEAFVKEKMNKPGVSNQ